MNPRAAVNDLHPFQGCPFGQLGYFSKCEPLNIPAMRVVQLSVNRESTLQMLTVVSAVNGEGGIRTHAPLRTNGFQDRLVMTTSIPLHVFWCRALNQREIYITIIVIRCQLIFRFFSKIILQPEDPPVL